MSLNREERLKIEDTNITLCRELLGWQTKCVDSYGRWVWASRTNDVIMQPNFWKDVGACFQYLVPVFTRNSYNFFTLFDAEQGTWSAVSIKKEPSSCYSGQGPTLANAICEMALKAI